MLASAVDDDLTIPVPMLNTSGTSTTTMMPSIRRRTSVLIAGYGDRAKDVWQLQEGSKDKWPEMETPSRSVGLALYPPI